MDGGFRAPRPSDRRVSSSRPEPKQQTAEVPVVAHSTSVSRHEKSPEQKPKKWLKFLIIAITVLLLAAAAWFGWSRMQSSNLSIDGSKYQAVFFTNGQVYFGKLKVANSDYMKLTDIYYLQAQNGTESDSENPQKAGNKDEDMQLIKLGDEIHGPEDQMMISKDQVLFFENLKSDGKVTKSIGQYKK